MPKVKPDYFNNKKERILNAAYDVCIRKPMHQVTMKDIIRETGISQGGIYRYYKNLDEILVEVINKVVSNKDYKHMIDALIKGSKKSEEVVKALLFLLAEYINDNVTTLGKLHFELIQLIAYEPERINSIASQNLHFDNTHYFMNQIFQMIQSGVESGEFKPEQPLNDILGFISTSIDGFVLDGILYKSYGIPENEYGFDVLRLMNTLVESVMCLLCVDK